MSYFDNCKTLNDLYNKLQFLKENPKERVNERVKVKKQPALNVPEHMRGNVRLKPDGFNYYERGGDTIVSTLDWSKVFEEAIDCMLAILKSNPNLNWPELPKAEPNEIIALNKIQECQEWCIKAEKIWNSDTDNTQQNGGQSESITEESTIPPIDLTKGTWNKSKNLDRLRRIDSNTKRDGITGTKKELRDMKNYLNKPRHNRSDIADTLTYDDGQIITSMFYGTMFLKK